MIHIEFFNNSLLLFLILTLFSLLPSFLLFCFISSANLEKIVWLTGNLSIDSMFLINFRQRGHLTLEFLWKFLIQAVQNVCPQWTKILGILSWKSKFSLQRTHVLRLMSCFWNSAILSLYSFVTFEAYCKK